MKIRVIDFETTGTDKDKAAGKPVGIVETGWTDLTRDGVISMPKSHLVNPGIPIPPEARATHHISDDDVRDAIDPTTSLQTLMSDMEPGDMFAAHNASFERAFFGGGTFPWICTLQCSKHLIDDAPSCSNQALRYMLGLDAEFEWPDLAMPPHRAGPDSYVTAHLLRRLLDGRMPTKLVELTVTPVLLLRVPMGKYEGRPWSEMDAGYLEWVLDPKREFSAEVTFTARHYLKALRAGGSPFGR